jgi:hypothetical protein
MATTITGNQLAPTTAISPHVATPSSPTAPLTTSPLDAINPLGLYPPTTTTGRETTTQT